MKLIWFSLWTLIRDWRSGELKIITIALILSVASLTTVGFFTDRIERAMEIQATELLAADLVLSSTTQIPETVIFKAKEQNLLTSRSTTFRSVVVHEERLQMTEVKAIEQGYPIRGKLKVANTLFGDEYITETIPGRHQVWVDSRLLQQLDLSLGDLIGLGAEQFEIAKVLVFEPDRGGDVFNIAPRLLMNQADVAATKLILPGSRVQFHLLLGGEIPDIADFRHWLSTQPANNLKIRGIRDARPELETALKRAEQFLGLAALVSIALAGIAVAMSTQRYVSRHLDHCAIMRCLGEIQSRVFSIYLLQGLSLALVCGVIGSGIGYLCQQGLAVLMSELMQGELPAPSLWPFSTGILTGLLTVCGFSVPQLLRLRAVTPMRVLRRDLEPLPVSCWIIYVMAILALALLMPWQSGNLRLSVYSFLGLLSTTIVLSIAVKIIIGLIRNLRLRGVIFRYGLANIARRSGQSVAQILSLGLGLMVMLLLLLIRTDLLDNWRERLPPDTPNYFLANIQPEEVEPLRQYIYEQGQIVTDFYPMILGRLIRINDQSVTPETYTNARTKRLVTREFNLSFANTMQPDNRLVTGDWWQENETGVLSVEEGIALALGIKTGDRLTYLVAGREVSGTVKNLRQVEWDSFNVNFFVVAKPETLRNFPTTYITSFFLSTAERELLSSIVKRYPSVTVFDIDAILSQVRILMEQVTRAIEYVFGFTLLAGIVVLLAALQTTHDERRQESALLRALGANQRQILGALTTEFACLGLVTGILATFGATLAEWILAKYVFNLPIDLNLWIWIYGPTLSTVIVVAGGLGGTRQVLKTPPMRALQQT